MRYNNFHNKIMGHPSTFSSAWRDAIEHLMARPVIQHGLVLLIIVNAIVLGIQTNAAAVAWCGHWLHDLDDLILGIFVIELLLLIAARGLRFFRDPWSVFDLLVIVIAFVPATGSLSVLRALRVLRILRLINKIQSMRTVVAGLLGSLPGLGSVFGLIVVIFYVSAVMATDMFGNAFPDRFGSLQASLYTLFQVMTLEGWSADIARPVMGSFPYAWVFFVLFVLVATFIVVNLFVAVIVNSIGDAKAQATSAGEADRDTVSQEIEGLRKELSLLKSLALEKRR